MYIKKQLDKILEIYRSYIYTNKILKEVDPIISKNKFTRIELLKVNELLKAMNKEVKNMKNKKQISKDKRIQEINKILAKKTLTKSDRLKFDKLIKTLDKDINEVY